MQSAGYLQNNVGEAHICKKKKKSGNMDFSRGSEREHRSERECTRSSCKSVILLQNNWALRARAQLGTKTQGRSKCKVAPCERGKPDYANKLPENDVEPKCKDTSYESVIFYRELNFERKCEVMSFRLNCRILKDAPRERAVMSEKPCSEAGFRAKIRDVPRLSPISIEMQGPMCVFRCCGTVGREQELVSYRCGGVALLVLMLLLLLLLLLLRGLFFFHSGRCCFLFLLQCPFCQLAVVAAASCLLLRRCSDFCFCVCCFLFFFFFRLWWRVC